MKTTAIFTILCTFLAAILTAQEVKRPDEVDKLSYNALKTKGDLLTKQGLYSEAFFYFQKRYELLPKQGEIQDSISSDIVQDIASAHFYIGQYDESIALLQKRANYLLKKNQFSKLDTFYIVAINDMAQAYLYANKFDSSEILYKEAMDLTKQMNRTHTQEYAIIINDLALVYLQTHEFEKAEPLCKENVVLWKNLVGAKHEYYANALGTLAGLYWETEEYYKSEPYYKEIITIVAALLGKNHPNYALELQNLASVYRMTNRFKEAIPLYKETLALYEKTVGKRNDYVSTSINLATAYTSNQQYDLAESTLNEIWLLSNSIFPKKHRDKVRILDCLAHNYRAKKETQKAIVYALKAIVANIEEDIDTLTLQDIPTLSNYNYLFDEYANSALQELISALQDLYEQTKDIQYQKLAYQVLEQSVLLTDKERNSFTFDNDKAYVLKKQAKILQKGMNIGLDLFEKEHKQAYLEELFLLAEQNKSVFLSNALQGQKALAMGALPDSLAQKEQQLQNDLANLKKQYIETRDAAEKSKLQNNITDLNFAIDDFKKQLQTQHPIYFQQKYDNSQVSFAKIQSLLPNNMALIEYVVTPDSLIFVFVITKQTIELKPILNFPLHQTIEQFRTTLTNYKLIQQDIAQAYRSYTTSAFDLYKNLLAPSLASLPKTINHLVIIPDNVLGHIPFEAFLTNLPDKKTAYEDLPYLLKAYQISYSYSASLLAENWKQKATSSHPTQKILACAATYAPQPANTTLTLAQAKRQFLAEIPATRSEVETISTILKGTFWYGNQTNERAFKQEAGQYNIIHLAMHGMLNEKHPILSSLAFTDNGDTVEDNFLEAWEISNLQLNASLVVLSACETGYGKFQQGEGIMSLGRAFMYAGVPSLVVSLWAVNDQSTSFIMKDFYKELNAGSNKAEALRQAKLHYLQSTKGIAAHPAFWSPFIQLGNSEPFQEDSNKLLWWGIGACIALLSLGLIGIIRKKRFA